MRRKLLLIILLILSVIPAFADESADLPPLVGVNPDNHVVVFDANAQTLISDVAGTNFFYARPVWSPDKTKVAYLVGENVQVSQNRSIYVWDGQQSVLLHTADDLGTGFPLTWSLDSTQVIFSAYASNPGQPDENFHVDVNVMAVNADGSSPAQRISGIQIAVGCGGGSDLPTDWAYWADTSLGGSHEAFFMTDYGLVFSEQCVGTNASLYNFQTGTTSLLADGGIGRVEISPDGRMIAGVKDNQLIRLNLETLVWEVIATPVIPDQLAWGVDGTIYYSDRNQTANLLDALSSEDRQKINTAYGYEVTEIWAYQTKIWKAGDNSPLYTADVYAIGRMEVTPDGSHLIFSTISNEDAYVQAIVSGAYNPMASDVDARRNYVTTDVYSLNLTSGEIGLVTEKFSQFDMAG